MQREKRLGGKNIGRNDDSTVDSGNNRIPVLETRTAVQFSPRTTLDIGQGRKPDGRSTERTETTQMSARVQVEQKKKKKALRATFNANRLGKRRGMAGKRGGPP